MKNYFFELWTKPMRVLTAMDVEEPDLVYAAATEIWKKIWSHDLDITDDGVITDALKRAGLESQRIEYYLGRVADQNVKDRLKSITQEGLDAGMFARV